MKKSILIVVLLLVVIFGIYYFVKQNEIRDSVINTQQNNSPTKEVSKDNVKEIRIGDLVLDIPKDLEIELLQDRSISVKIPGVYAETINVNKRTQIQEKEILIYVYKDDNKNQLSLKQWVDNNGPQSYKHSSIPEKEQYIKVNNLDAYLTVYLARETGSDFDYYNREKTYLAHQDDIYDIWNYRKSLTQYYSLTPEEQKSIENYEKIVNQIIQSIRFVE